MQPPNPPPSNSGLWSFISENPLASAIVSTLIVALILWLVQKYRAKRDSEVIYEFLCQSKKEGKFEFRSTEAISAHTKFTEARVEELCCMHPKISRNKNERQTWYINT